MREKEGLTKLPSPAGTRGTSTPLAAAAAVTTTSETGGPSATGGAAGGAGFAASGGGGASGAARISPSRAALNHTILLSMYNMKGGVGKTTSVLEFGYNLAKDGFKVLLVDADMQANLTGNIIMASRISTRTNDGGAAAAQAAAESEYSDDLSLSADEAYDQLWREINEAERSGSKKTFPTILDSFTQRRLYLKKDFLDTISPLSIPISGSTSIDYIAGHMKTADYEAKIAEGFSDERRYPIPGMVTNVFREFAQKNNYDFVIFDLGCTLTATVKAVLLGSDYIVSPFKCERSCKTAAEIVLKKLRDWHYKTIGDKTNPEYVLAIKDAMKREEESKMLENSRSSSSSETAVNDEISVVLKCFPHFLGAFPVGVRLKIDRPTIPYQLRIDEIFAEYEEQIRGFKKLPKTNLNALKKCVVENSESAGKEAEGGGSVIQGGIAIPCISLCYDLYRGNRSIRLRTFQAKAGRISRQYGDVLRALVSNMAPEHRDYIIGKSSTLFHETASLAPDAESSMLGSTTPVAGVKRSRSAAAATTASKTLAEEMADFSQTPALFSARRARPRSKTVNFPGMEGFSILDVPGDGNCLYHAVADQLMRGHHPYPSTVPEGTELYDSLRLLAEGPDFEDGRWGDHPEIGMLANGLNLIICIVSTTDPRHELMYHYISPTDASLKFTRELEELPEGQKVLYLAYTGDHYLSILKLPTGEAPGVRVLRARGSS